MKAPWWKFWDPNSGRIGDHVAGAVAVITVLGLMALTEITP